MSVFEKSYTDWFNPVFKCFAYLMALTNKLPDQLNVAHFYSKLDLTKLLHFSRLHYPMGKQSFLGYLG